MGNFKNGNRDLIEKSYMSHYSGVLNFIHSRINNMGDAENLTQDVWLRLLTYGKDLTSETVVPFIYTVTRNIVNDYLRRLYCESSVYDEISMTVSEETSDSPDTIVSARQLSRFEKRKIECLPGQRRIIYVMSRFEDKTVKDIATELSLSCRTVENHLRMGRRDVRAYMAAIA